MALIVIFALGLLGLLGALTMMRSSPPPGAVPVPAPPASPSVSPPAGAAPAPPPEAVSAVPAAPVARAAPSRGPAVAKPQPPSPVTTGTRPAGVAGARPAAVPAGTRDATNRALKDPAEPARSRTQAADSSGGALPAPAAEKSAPISKTYECRESAVFNVDPEEAVVTVDGHRIGTADEWDDAGGGKKYKFQGPGIHYVKLTLEGYETMWLKFVVSGDAKKKTADVDLDMTKSHR